MYFRYFVIISPRKKVWLFIWTNLNSLYLGMFCAKFGWNWFSAYGEDFYKFVNVCSPFCSCLPLEKGVAFHLNKLECPSPKDALRQVWLKLAQWFWRKRWKCEKFTDGQRWMTGYQKFSSGEITTCGYKK